MVVVGGAYCSHMSTNRGGVAVLFAKHFLPVSCLIQHEIPGRFLVVKAQYEHFYIYIVNVYAPTVGAEQVCFFKSIGSLLRNCTSGDFLVLGGILTAQADQVDRNQTKPHVPSLQALIRLLQEHKLADIWRVMNPAVRQYSWVQMREGFISLARLDRFYCFQHQLNIVNKCVIEPVGFSDHCLVMCSFFISNLKSKSAYWHFNISLLSD